MRSSRNSRAARCPPLAMYGPPLILSIIDDHHTQREPATSGAMLRSPGDAVVCGTLRSSTGPGWTER